MTPPDTSWIKTVTACVPTCKERQAAMCDEVFLPAKSLGGWIFIDGPYRQLADLIKWKNIYFGNELEDHSGKPYVWIVCPFCGGDLPAPLMDYDESDGEDGG